jgi:hypothetical protein
MLLTRKEPTREQRLAKKRREIAEYDQLMAEYQQSNRELDKAHELQQQYDRGGPALDAATDEDVEAHRKLIIQLNLESARKAGKLRKYAEEHGDNGKLDRDLCALEDEGEREEQQKAASEIVMQCRLVLVAAKVLAEENAKLHSKQQDARTRWRRPLMRGDQITVPAAEAFLPGYDLGFQTGILTPFPGCGRGSSLLSSVKIQMAMWRPEILKADDPLLENAAEGRRFGLNAGLIPYATR